MANSNNNTDKKLREALANRGLDVSNKEAATNSNGKVKKPTTNYKRNAVLNRIRRIESGFGLHGW